MNDNPTADDVAKGVAQCKRSGVPLLIHADYLVKLRDVDGLEPQTVNLIGQEVLRLLRHGN